MQGFVRRRLHDGEEIALQKGQNGLRFRVAKATIVFNHLRSLRGEHQPKIEASAKGAPFFLHCAKGGHEDGLHACFRDIIGIVRIGRNDPHTTRIESLIPIQSTLVIHTAHHGHEGFAIGKTKHRHFWPCEEFFNHNLLARCAKFAPLHHV